MKIDELRKFFPKNLIDCWETQHCSSELTDLQEKIFRAPDLLFSDDDLLIQAPTSSGKTFVAEVSAAYTMLNKVNNGVLYLVPFRALVSEKYRTFLETFSAMDLNVFQSSSDYRMFDRNILSGNYDIVITIYEKLLSFLMGGDADKILTRCSLIVFDELQLISDSDRGPKIEMLMVKIRSMPDAIRPKLLGLVTSGYDCTKILHFFNGNMICSDKRPVPLEEKLMDAKDGNYWTFYDPLPDAYQNGKQSYWVNYEKIPEEQMESPNSQSGSIIKHGVFWLLSNPEINYNADSKIIIFCPSRQRAEKYAKEFASLQHRRFLIPQNAGILDLDREPKYRLISYCLMAKTAFHHAGLSLRLREYIEREFLQENGAIRFLFSTETLSVGINLPADVVIIAENSKYEGKTARQLTYSEYKNFLGRAGRLGLNAFGKSYFVLKSVDEAEQFRARILKREKIVLDTGIDASEIHTPLPYVLFLLLNAPDSILDEEDLREYISESTLMGEKIACRVCDYIELARKHHLISDGDLSLTALGEVMATRLFDTEMLQIFTLMKNAVSVRAINYFDLLYFACHAPRILTLNAFHLRSSEKTDDSWVLNYLERFIQESELISAEWENSWVFDKLTAGYHFDANDRKALKCAVTLYLWKETCDVKRLSAVVFQDVGDIVTCAETVSYVIECFCDVCQNAWGGFDSDTLVSDLRKFSYEVHIGASGGTATLASMQLSSVSVYSLNKVTASKHHMPSIFSESVIGMMAFCLTRLHMACDASQLEKHEYFAIIAELLQSYSRYAPPNTSNATHLALAYKYSALAKDDAILTSMLELDQDSPPYQAILSKVLSNPPFSFELPEDCDTLSIPGLPPLPVYRETLQDSSIAIAEFDEIFAALKRTGSIRRFVTWEALLSDVCLALFASEPRTAFVSSLATVLDSYRGRVIAVGSIPFSHTGIDRRTAIVAPFEQETLKIAESLCALLSVNRKAFVAPIGRDHNTFWTDLMIESSRSSSNLILILPTRSRTSFSTVSKLLGSLKGLCRAGEVSISLISESPEQFADGEVENMNGIKLDFQLYEGNPDMAAQHIAHLL